MAILKIFWHRPIAIQSVRATKRSVYLAMKCADTLYYPNVGEVRKYLWPRLSVTDLI